MNVYLADAKVPNKVYQRALSRGSRVIWSTATFWKVSNTRLETDTSVASWLCWECSLCLLFCVYVCWQYTHYHHHHYYHRNHLTADTCKKKSGLRFLCQDSILKKVLNVWVQIPLTTVKVSFSLICALLGSLVDSSNVFNYCLCSLDTTDRWVTLISSRDRIFSPERTTIQQGDGVFVHILAAFATLMYLHALDVSVNTFRLMWFLVLVKKRRQKQIHVKENVMLSFNEQMVKPYSCLHRQTTF